MVKFIWNHYKKWKEERDCEFVTLKNKIEITKCIFKETG